MAERADSSVLSAVSPYSQAQQMMRTNKGAKIAASRMFVNTTPVGDAPLVKSTTRMPMTTSAIISASVCQTHRPRHARYLSQLKFHQPHCGSPPLQQHTQTASTEPRIMR